MLLPDNIHPESTLLYNGGLVIRALHRVGDATLLDLYFEVRKESSLSMPLFVLSLDWLYLANCIDVSEQGKLSLCS